MTCLSIEQIAALASGADDGTASEHVETCKACRDAVREQREMAVMAKQWVPAPMGSRRRAEMAAEVLAESESESESEAPAASGRRRRGWIVGVGVGGVAAAAAAIAIAIGMLGHAETKTETETPVIAVMPPTPTPTPTLTPTPELVPVAPKLAEIASHGAQFTRAQIAARDTVQLRSGELVVDTRDREPAVIVAHGAEVSIDHARVAVVARNGVVVSLHVFAGSAEMTDGSTRRVIQAGEVWTRPADVVAVTVAAPRAPAPVAPDPSAASSALVAFRDGWQSLQAGDNLVAVAAFDRATDPVVAEDATFWAAVAEQRAGRADDAARRLRAFLDAFPDSPRADAARTRLAALDPPR